MADTTALLGELKQLGPPRLAAPTWQPLLFQLERTDHRQEIATRLAAGDIREWHDQLADQLSLLVRVRQPTRHFTAAELEWEVAQLLGGRPAEEYGCWVFYPWTGRLIHLLGQAEFQELRADRNRNLITTEEQQRLRTKRIGIIGLSVGHAIVCTLALEGIGGELRLADRDRLDLTNLNRIRAGVQELGQEKTILAARAIGELDPYLELRLFRDGLGPENLDTFLLEGGPLHLVIEECDDLELKLLVRERARDLGIPVLMETSNRGMLDIERFDLEPSRPVLHGLLGELAAHSLRGLTLSEKVPYVIRLLGENNLATVGPSLAQVQNTLSGWPQLGSHVTLGAATSADTARRLLLGQPLGSGRFYVDLAELIREAPTNPHSTIPVAAGATAGPARERDATLIEGERPVPHARPTAEEYRQILQAGLQAPSGGNVQAWKFRISEGVIACRVDTERGWSTLDFQRLSSVASLGAVLENMRLQAGLLGYATETVITPGADELPVCNLRLQRAPSPLSAVELELAQQIERRHTNRRWDPQPSPPDVAELRHLDEVARRAGAELRWLTEPAALTAMGALMGQWDRISLTTAPLDRELLAELRWSPAEVERTRDGLDVRSLELTWSDRLGLRALLQPTIAQVVIRLRLSRLLESLSRRWIGSAMAVGLLTVPGHDPLSYLRGGIAFERVWLAATTMKLAFHPMAALPYLFARLERVQGEGLPEPVIQELRRMREQYLSLFPGLEEQAEVLLFRLAHNRDVSLRSWRRPLDDLLEE